jgi:phosphate transport system substrate-binding protein
MTLRMKKRLLPCLFGLLVHTACTGPEPETRAECPVFRRPPGLIVAGSGACLALARELASRFDASHPGSRTAIPGSIGTGGAVRAVRDGAVDVGLASRLLSASERSLGIREHPITRTALVIVAHPGVPAKNLDVADLADLYSGRRTEWSDGTRVVPLLREPGDSGEHLLVSTFPELEGAFEEARRKDRGLICYTDQEMRDALLEIPGAVGFLDLGTIRLERLALKPMALNGVDPGRDTVVSGRYPLVRTLSFLTNGPPIGTAREFIEFARSSALADLWTGDAFLEPLARDR